MVPYLVRNGVDCDKYEIESCKQAGWTE